MTPHEGERAFYWEGEGLPVPCRVLNQGAFVSLVAYSVGGVYYEVYVENEDIMFQEEED